MKSSSALWVVAAVLFLSMSLFAQSRPTATSPTSSPASGSASQPAGAMGQFIAAIRTASEPSAAVTAYAKACAIDARSLELNNTYMRRMLTLGQPQIAYSPALILNGNDPGNGLAWAVGGYVIGKRGDYPAAIVATTRAMENGLADDASVLNNMGQLLAWYDNQEMPPKLPDAVRRTVDKNRETWAKSEDYAQGFQKIQAYYGTWLKDRKELENKIVLAEGAVQEAGKKLSEIESAYREKQSDLDSHKDNQKELMREYWLTSDTDPNAQSYRNSLLNRLRIEARAIEADKSDMDAIRRDGVDAQNNVKNKQAVVDQLRQAMQTPDKAKLQRLFRWDPPHVDGVLTPEVETFPLPIRTTSQANDPESLAATRLRLANMYLQNNMNKEAVEALGDIISKYPNTKAAAVAKDLLSKTPKE